MADTAHLARAARQLSFTVGQQDLRDPRIEFAAAVQYAVRTGATLYWGQTRAFGFVGYTTLAELIAVDAQIRSAVPAGQPAPTAATCVAHRRISPDGTVVEVKADGTEKAPRDAVMARLGEILADADPHAEG